MPPFIIDAHQDIAYNIRSYNRDYTLPVDETRHRETGSRAVTENGNTLLGWPEYKSANVTAIFSTLFAAPATDPMHQSDPLMYHDSDGAHHLYLEQIDAYEKLVAGHPDKFQIIRTKSQFVDGLEHSKNDPIAPISLVILMEGADCIRSVEETGFWWQKGVRIIGPAWKATRYCGGTGQPGPLTDEGHKLLKEMAKYGYILDISHMDWAAALQSLDEYPGTIIASHANMISKVVGGTRNRFLTDEIGRKLIGRNGVIGVIPFNNFLIQGWSTMDDKPSVSLSMVADQIDFICQLAGNANHAALGTDFDGGFGVELTPDEIDTIADLQKLAPMLQKRGYKEEEINQIFGVNWASILTRSLPE